MLPQIDKRDISRIDIEKEQDRLGNLCYFKAYQICLEPNKRLYLGLDTKECNNGRYMLCRFYEDKIKEMLK